MINIEIIKNYCKDYNLIENYNLAMIDQSQTWDCHHRLETELNLSRQELIDSDLYYNRPPSELIFLTRSDHISIHHNDARKRKTSERNKQYWKNTENRQKHSEQMKGNKASLNHRWMTNGVDEICPAPEKIDYYLNLGYRFGRK